jgi:hypothetical protein
MYLIKAFHGQLGQAAGGAWSNIVITAGAGVPMKCSRKSSRA